MAGDHETHLLRESEASLISSCCFQATRQLVSVVKPPSSLLDLSVETWPSLTRFAHFGAAKKNWLSEHPKIHLVVSEKLSKPLLHRAQKSFKRRLLCTSASRTKSRCLPSKERCSLASTSVLNQEGLAWPLLAPHGPSWLLMTSRHCSETGVMFIKECIRIQEI